MRTWLSILLSCLAIGSAARHQPPRTVSASWSTVEGLPAGTEVAVYLSEQDARHGALDVVSGQTRTIRGSRGVEALSRAKIERIAVRTATGASRKASIVQTALIGPAITGGLGLFAQMMEENPRPDGQKWSLFIAGTAAGASIGAMRAPRETFSKRVVYIRP